MAIKIFIDQGHNPQNPNAGAEANGVREQDITYDIGVRLGNLLRANPNFEVKLSRNSPTEQLGTSNATSLQARATMANSWGADYVYSLSSPAYQLGESILDGLNYRMGMENRGVFARPSLYVLRATSMPAVLVEMGFLTNQHDVYLLTRDPEGFARGMYNGILMYFGLL